MVMDWQKFFDQQNEDIAKERGHYHLSYGELVKALKEAPSDATFDERVRGIGSWRGSYIEIALFTDSDGAYVQDEEFQGDFKEYGKWEKAHSTQISELPRNANELGALLESFIGQDFVGWKGGNYTIEEYKPLWLEPKPREYSKVAIIGIDKDLNLILKHIVDAEED